MYEALRSLSLPAGFTTRAEAEKNLRELYSGIVNRDFVETPELEAVVDALHNPQLEAMIAENRATIGLIKPRANEGRNLPLDDDLAAQVIASEVGSQRLYFQMPILFTLENSELFYKALKAQYSAVLRPTGETVFSSITRYLSSGAVTLMIIGDEAGNSFQWWRNKIGATNPDQASPDSIRGKYGDGTKLPNNLVHGSDSTESALHELATLQQSLTEIHNLLRR